MPDECTRYCYMEVFYTLTKNRIEIDVREYVTFVEIERNDIHIHTEEYLLFS